jgi:hypothetical protein
MRIRDKIVLLTVTASFCVMANMAVGQEAPSNYEHLKEYGEVIIGEWVTEFDVDFDYPPLVKKGDKALIKDVNKWILNKNAIDSQTNIEVNGVTILSAHGTIGWDKAAKRIVSYGFNSLGGRGEGVIEKRGDKWYSAGNGVDAMGKVGAGMSILTIIDSDTREDLGVGRLSPQDEPLPNAKSTTKRVKK